MVLYRGHTMGPAEDLLSDPCCGAIGSVPKASQDSELVEECIHRIRQGHASAAFEEVSIGAQYMVEGSVAQFRVTYDRPAGRHPAEHTHPTEGQHQAVRALRS